MPLNNETLNRRLYKVLAKYNPKPLNSKGDITPVEDDADVFKFVFSKDGVDYGDVFATIDDKHVLSLYYGDDVADSPSNRTTGLDYDDSWSGFLEFMKSWATQRNGLGWNPGNNKDHLARDMARREHLKNKETMAEGYYPQGKSKVASYSDAIPNVKIILQHSRPIEEGDQRYRNISKIFVENTLGERFVLPTIKPGIARVYARHVAEGGTPYDQRGTHITSLVEEYQKMAGFVRATRNTQFNESAQELINEGLSHYQSLRETLNKMSKYRGYNAYFESWTPPLNEAHLEESNLNELFVQETLDPRIESVMPILSRLHKKVSEMTEVTALAEWADHIIEGDGGQEALNPIGIPEDDEDVSEGVDDIIKGVKRLVKGKPTKGEVATKHELKSLGAAHANDWKTAGKEATRWEKVKNLPKQQGVAEGYDGEYDDEAGMAKGNLLSTARAVEGLLNTIKDRDNLPEWVQEKIAKAEMMLVNAWDHLRSQKEQGIDPQIDGPEDMDEDLDANQKRVGQLGPYEKVGKQGAVGKLVGEGIEEQKCPECGGAMFRDLVLAEKKDACYAKVRSRYKVWPSAYASGALVQCRKKGASNWGNKSESIEEGTDFEDLDENLHKWFDEKWVRFGPDGKIRGDCARGDDSEGKPKCLPQSKAQNLGKKGRASAAARKRREDPNPERSGKAINVNTKKKTDEDITEVKASAAVRMQKEIEKQRAKSDASLARTPSSIPKAELASKLLSPLVRSRMIRKLANHFKWDASDLELLSDEELTTEYNKMPDTTHTVSESKVDTMSDELARIVRLLGK